MISKEREEGGEIIITRCTRDNLIVSLIIIIKVAIVKNHLGIARV